MAVQTTPHPDTPHDSHDDRQASAVAAHRTSPVLIGALAVALVALGVWWSQQRDAGTDVPMAATPTPILVEAPSTAVATRQAESARVSAAPRNARVASIDHGPRPLADNPAPAYPLGALRSGSEGRVVVNIEVGADGTPSDVSVAERSGDRALDRAALQAARQWRFEPAMRDGKAVSATVRLPVDFRRG